MAAPRKAVTAQKAEAVDKTARNINFRSRSYTFSNDPKAVPIEALEALEPPINMIGFVKAILGDKQYAVLRQDLKTVADLQEFFEQSANGIGAEPGE